MPTQPTADPADQAREVADAAGKERVASGETRGLGGLGVHCTYAAVERLAGGFPARNLRSERTPTRPHRKEQRGRATIGRGRDYPMLQENFVMGSCLLAAGSFGT